MNKNMLDKFVKDGKELQDLKTLNTPTILKELLVIFKKHIGSKNAITRAMLFKKIFGRKEKGLDFGDMFRWEKVRNAMRMLRLKTRCFVVGKNTDGKWKFFVVKSKKDAKFYCNILSKSIVGMKTMQRKAKKAVDEQWYKKKW